MVFVFDENYSKKLAHGLNLLEQGNRSRNNTIAEVWHILDLAEHLNIEKEDPKSSYSDSEVIKIAGKVNGIVVTQDDDFRRIKHLYELQKQLKVGVIYFKTFYDSRGYWNMVTTVIQKWDELKTKASKNSPPFCYLVDKQGVKEHSY